MSCDRPGFVEIMASSIHRFIYGNRAMEGVVKVARPFVRPFVASFPTSFHSFILPFGISDARATNCYYDGRVLYRVIADHS